MTFSEHGFKSVTLKKEGLRQNVASSLLASIFRSDIRSGDRLAAQTLANQLGVSATPVREALVELASIGVVEMQANRGAVCVPFGPRELREIYDLRRILEVEATRLACGRIADEKLRDLRIEMAKLAERKTANWSQLAMLLDTELHGMIQSHCGSKRLAYELDRYQGLIGAIRHVVGDRFSVQVRAVEQHIEIIDGLVDHDPDRACDAMARHIDATVRGVERAMFMSKPRNERT